MMSKTSKDVMGAASALVGSYSGAKAVSKQGGSKPGVAKVWVDDSGGAAETITWMEIDDSDGEVVDQMDFNDSASADDDPDTACIVPQEEGAPRAGEAAPGAEQAAITLAPRASGKDIKARDPRPSNTQHPRPSNSGGKYKWKPLWKTNRPWLHYDEQRKEMFCKAPEHGRGDCPALTR
jgi:hypothetical protein